MSRIPLTRCLIHGLNTFGIIIIFITFLMASMNPDFSILISFNDYGEAIFEYFIFVAALALSAYVIVDDIRGDPYGL